jgi:hypothetical protein
MVTVADGLVELGEFVDMVDQCLGGGANQRGVGHGRFSE